MNASHSAALPVVIRAVRDVAAGVREFSFGRSDGQEFPLYSAGSHVVLALPIGERIHRNPYSLVGDPAVRDTWRIAVQRHPHSRGGSAWLYDHAKPGMTIELSPPVNLFALVRTARLHLLVAGGIGITPILAQARELTRLGEPFEVHYAYRGEHSAALVDEVEALGPQRVFRYDSATGRKLSFKALLDSQPLGTHLYICGPAGMVADCMAAGAELGWPANHLHSEQFIAPAGGEPFEVELARSRKRFTVPSDQSLLEAMEQQGVDPPYLCRGGACGQCETEVLQADGELLHQDVYLSAEERASGRKIMPCVSRLKGGCLVLNS